MLSYFESALDGTEPKHLRDYLAGQLTPAPPRADKSIWETDRPLMIYSEEQLQFLAKTPEAMRLHHRLLLWEDVPKRTLGTLTETAQKLVDHELAAWEGEHLKSSRTLFRVPRYEESAPSAVRKGTRFLLAHLDTYLSEEGGADQEVTYAMQLVSPSVARTIRTEMVKFKKWVQAVASQKTTDDLVPFLLRVRQDPQEAGTLMEPSTSTTGAAQENRRLAFITQVTSFGDFISLFAVLKWLSDSGVSAAVGGYAVVVKSLGVGVGAALIPLALSRSSTQAVILLSQLLSALCSLFLLALIFRHEVHAGTHSIVATFGLIFGQTVLKQLFDGARETHSKVLSVGMHPMSAQAQLLASFYGAQFLGPIASFALIQWFPVTVPLILDAASFLMAAGLALRLTGRDIRSTAVHVLRPLAYLGCNPLLRDIVLLRSVVFWFSIGLFNYLLFSVVTDHYGLPLTYSAWIYSAMGLGAAVSSSILRGSRGAHARLLRLNEGALACGAQLAFAALVLAFFNLPSFPVALVALAALGLAMGANAVATQTLRRKFSTDAQFPEVVGFELILGRIADVSLSSLAAVTLLSHSMSYKAWLWVSVSVLVISAMLHLRFLTDRTNS